MAITREVPESLADGLATHSNTKSAPLSVQRAKKQHDLYVNHLKSILPKQIVSLPSLSEHPDCVFVEDTAVAIGTTAVVNRIGHESRQGEVDDVKSLLVQLGLTVTDMRDCDGATCDGGDVLWHKKDNVLYVGLSNRTNTDGAEVLRRTFEPFGVKVATVPATNEEALHLKSVVTALDDKTLVAPIGPLGDEVLAAMGLSCANDIVRLPDIACCNLVSLNGAVLAQETECEESRCILKEETTKRNLQLHHVDTSEFATIDGTNVEGCIACVCAMSRQLTNLVAFSCSFGGRSINVLQHLAKHLKREANGLIVSKRVGPSPHRETSEAVE